MADLEERVANLESELKEAKEKIQQLFTLVQSGGSGSASAKPKAPARKPSSASTTASARPPSSAKSTNGAAKKPAAKPTLSSASKVPDEKIAVDPAYLVTYNIGKRKQHVVIPGDVDPAQAKLAAEAKTGLTLSRVYGFNGKAARHNLFHSREQAGSIIYSVAATGVVMDTKTGQQNFFTGHNEDILCVAYHPSRPVVATGQLDPKGKGTPFTCVWTYTENGTQELCRIVFHDRGVCAVQFSADGKYLLTIGNDDSHTLAIFDWENTKHKGQKAVPVLETMTSKDEVFGMEVNRHSTEQKGIDIEFVTFGSKTLKHWAVSNITHDDVKQRTAKSRIISVSNKTNIVQKSYGCVEFLPSGEYLVGCASGHIYRMKQDSLVTFFAAHSKAVGAIRAIENGFVSAGADGKFVMWDNSNNQTASIDLQDGGAGRSISISGNTAVVGTASNWIIEVDLGSHNQRVLMVGHSNEVWGLAVANNLLVTGGFDKKVIAWDFQSGEFIPVHSLATGSKVKSVAFNPDGTRLALGMDNGHVQVVSVADWSTEWDKDFAKETIDGLAWSPDGSSIAAGSWDQNLYLIDASNGAKKATCSGHTSSVLMVNWSQDGNYLQSNSRDYEILYWTSAGKRLKDRLEIKDIKWSAWNCFLGWCVAGIWGGTGDGTDINAVDRSHNESVLAAGDDFGMVRLYNYPAVNANSPPKEYPGHSSHVTNVRFSPDDSVLFSTGGGDCGVFMWKHE